MSRASRFHGGDSSEVRAEAGVETKDISESRPVVMVWTTWEKWCRYVDGPWEDWTNEQACKINNWSVL